MSRYTGWGVLIVWKVYADDAEAALEVVAESEFDARRVAARRLGCSPDDLICRYTAGRSGLNLLPSVRPWGPEAGPGQWTYHRHPSRGLRCWMEP